VTIVKNSAKGNGVISQEVVDKNYQYTLIGSSTEDYLWILSRTPELEKVTLEKCLTNLKNRGYDTSKLIFIKQ
jgi:lipocalin